MDLAALEPNDRLTYLLGDITRSDTFAENEARSVWVALSRSPTAAVLAPRDFARVLEQATELLAVCGLPSDLSATTRRILTEALAAHRERNLLVHDYWMQHLPSDEVWHSLRALASRKQVKPHRPLADFERCRDALLRAGWQLRSLWLLLPFWLGDTDALHGVEEARALWREVAAGRFRIDPSGLTVVAGDAATDGAAASA